MLLTPLLQFDKSILQVNHRLMESGIVAQVCLELGLYSHVEHVTILSPESLRGQGPPRMKAHPSKA